MIDHLVYATPDLATTIAELAQRFGLTPSEGGAHPGFGTRNVLADLGDGRYLEIVGPDPGQPAPDRPRPFGVDRLTEPRLVTWAAGVSGLTGVVERSRRAGYDPGEIIPMSRRRPDGVLLEWRLTAPTGSDGVASPVPFLIDWGDSPHPARTAASGLNLVSLRGFHPRRESAERQLDALGVRLELDDGPEPLLVAELDAPAGRVVLR